MKKILQWAFPAISFVGLLGATYYVACLKLGVWMGIMAVTGIILGMALLICFIHWLYVN